MQNDCAESMLKSCYEKLYPGQTLSFDLSVLDLPQADLQPELLSVLVLDDDQTFLTSNDPRELERFLARLDKNQYYFLRTGQVGGAGHFQILRFMNDGWELYSSPRNRQILTLGENLTQAGKERLLGSEHASARWGTQPGHYCLLVKSCTQERLQQLMVYLDAFRTGTGTAQQRDERAFNTALNPSAHRNRYILVTNHLNRLMTPELMQLLAEVKAMLQCPSRNERYFQLDNSIDNYLAHADENSQQALIDALNPINFCTEHGAFKQCIYRLLILLGVRPQTLHHWRFFKSPILELKCALHENKLDAKL